MLSKDRRKADSKMVTITVAPVKLRAIFGQELVANAFSKKKVGKTVGESSTPLTPRPKDEYDQNSSLPPPSPDNASESSPVTPAPNTPATGDATPVPMSSRLAPPDVTGATATKKKGAKRTSIVAGVDFGGGSGPGSSNGDMTAPRGRTKPGPKKRAKLDDGIAEPRVAGTGGAHKLGPKASMGAINAGLRALDRSGKPCRRWAKGGFQLKSFTGVVWEVPRWRAPTKSSSEVEGDDSTPVSMSASASVSASVDGSNKENDEASKDTKGDKPAVNSINGTAKDEVRETNGTTSDVDMADDPSTQPSPPDAAAEASDMLTPTPITA